MKFQISNLWAAALLVFVLLAINTYFQESPDSMNRPLQTAKAALESPSKIDKMTALDAGYFYEVIMNWPDRIAKAQAVALDNELEQFDECQNANFFDNPLLLNGKPLEYADFDASSRGTLTVVEGDPKSPAAAKIPFKIYLRRAGAIITAGKSDINKEVTEIEISEILSLALPDDHLIIVPARKSDWKAKRILKITGGC